MKLLWWIDGGILDRAQWVSDLMHEWFGCNNFCLARLFAVGLPLVGWLRVFRWGLNWHSAGDAALLGVVGSVYYYFLIPRTEQITDWAASRGLRNPTRCDASCAFGRIFLFLMAAAPPYDLFPFDLGAALMFLSYTFNACDPKPPAKSRLKQWIESFNAVRQELPVHG